MATRCWLRYYNEGIGKPETLTVNLTGFRSRRINDKDRLIYKIDEENVYILDCSNHYADKDSAILKQEMNLPGLLQWKSQRLYSVICWQPQLLFLFHRRLYVASR